MNPEDETSYTTQYQAACLKYVKTEYCTKHRPLSVTTLENNQHSEVFRCLNAFVLGRASLNPYRWPYDQDEYLTSKCVAETRSRRRNCAEYPLTAARLNLNSPPDSPYTAGQVNPNFNDYHSDPMEMSSTFWLRDITDWW